ncbi:hypothetical protein GCM10028857_10290 [Salinarchaeum chitinilyticum]
MASSSSIAVAVIALLVAGGITTFGLALVAWRRRNTPGTKTFHLFLGAQLLYLLGTLGVFLSPGPRFATGLYLFASVAAVAVGVTWVLFTIEYAGYWDRLRWWGHALLWGQPAVYSLGVITNPWHGAIVSTETVSYGGLTLVSVTYHPIGQFELVYIVLLVIFSFALLGHLFLRTRNVHRKQTATIFLGALLPTAAYVLFWTEFAPHQAMDLTPVAFVLQSIVVGWALFRYDFLSVSPIATELYIQQMADPLVVLDERDRLVDYNESAAAALGLDEADDRAHVREISPALASAMGEDGGTVELSTDGGVATFDLTDTVIRDRHERVRGSMLVLRDVTELEEHRAELERKNAQLEQFTSVVSHDLRNPLNVAQGFAELARDERDFDALERSIEAMDDMEALIEDLLTLAREGQTVDEVELVSFLDVVQAAWDEAPTAGATLEVADDADFECYADPDRFQELLGNLFRNAVEHGAPDEDELETQPVGVTDGDTGPETIETDGDSDVAAGPALTVTVGRLADRGGFYLEDDGVGISDSEAADVFESGYTTSSSGTGLGLAIVRSIASGHGWGVSLTGSDRGGARFEFVGVRFASDR